MYCSFHTCNHICLYSHRFPSLSCLYSESSDCVYIQVSSYPTWERKHGACIIWGSMELGLRVGVHSRDKERDLSWCLKEDWGPHSGRKFRRWANLKVAKVQVWAPEQSLGTLAGFRGLFVGTRCVGGTISSLISSLCVSLHLSNLYQAAVSI